MGDRLSRVTGELSSFKQRERERESYTSLRRCRDNVSYENYKLAKREPKMMSKRLDLRLMMDYIARS